MKKAIYSLLCLPLIVIGQTQTENYYKSTVYKVPTTVSISNPTIDQANQTVTYLDGFGRPFQTVSVMKATNGNNIINQTEYDVLGRANKEYLPYVATNNGLNYESSGLSDVLTYPSYVGETPYSEKIFKNYLHGRLDKQSAPGNDWALGNGREIKLDYISNVVDEVKLYKATSNWNGILYDISPVNFDGTVAYPPYALYKTVTYDENTNQIPNEIDGSIVEFKNKQGQTVLKRSYESTIPHDTYYVYDQFSNLIYVIPPLVNTTLPITTQILESLCYQYKYDYRNRLVEKNSPAKIGNSLYMTTWIGL